MGLQFILKNLRLLREYITSKLPGEVFHYDLKDITHTHTHQNHKISVCFQDVFFSFWCTKKTYLPLKVPLGSLEYWWNGLSEWHVCACCKGCHLARFRWNSGMVVPFGKRSHIPPWGKGANHLQTYLGLWIYVSYPWRVTVWQFFWVILREIFDSLLEKTTEELLSLTQCKSLGNRLYFMDGHAHCNYVWDTCLQRRPPALASSC